MVAGYAADTTEASAPIQGTDWRRLPDEPYIVVAHGAPYFRPNGSHGWKASDPSETVATIRGLHTDFLDFRRLVWADGNTLNFPPGVQEQLAFSDLEQLPATTAQTIYLLTNGDELERIGWLKSENDWTLPDGSPVESTVELLGKRFDGEPHGFQVQGGYRGVPSVFAPSTLDVLTHEAEQTLSEGFVSMFADSITTPRLEGLDFSPWAQAAFRAHLATLSTARLDELGVDDPNTLDVRTALRERGVAPEQIDDPRDDPLFRAYHRHHHRGMKALVRAYRETLHEQFPERSHARGATLNANHYVGDAFDSQPAAGVYTTDHVDYVTVEDNRTKPPTHVREPLYKLARATTRGEKPALVEGQMQSITGNDSTRGLSLDRKYFTLRRLQFAEAYANGVPRKIPLTGWGNVNIEDTITHWLEADGSVPSELQSLVDFLWTNQRFLRGATPDNDVAVVFSLPTLLWHRIPQWGQNATRQRAAFRGAATVLRQAQVPYDVAVFGHTELWNDDWQLDRLSEYDAVVLPEVDCLNDAQADALAAVLDDSGTVVTTGRQPSRGENYEQREFAWLDRDGVVSLDESPLVERRDEDTDDRPTPNDRLGEVLSEAASVKVSEPYPLAVNRLRNGDIRQVHLLNYDYDEAADEVATKTDVTVTVENESATAARWVSPTEVSSLDVESVDSGVRVTVPAVREWGFVVFADSAAALRSDASEADARAAVSDQQSLVDEHEPLRVTTKERVATMLAEAELALDSGAYDLAIERADRVHEALERYDLLPATTTATTADPTTTETDTETPPTETEAGNPPSSTEQTGGQTNSNTPGFGTGVGLTALGVGALWRYLRGDSTESE